MRKFVGVVEFWVSYPFEDETVKQPPIRHLLIYHVKTWTRERAYKKVWEYIRTKYDSEQYFVRSIEIGTEKEFWSDDPMPCRYIGLMR